MDSIIIIIGRSVCCRSRISSDSDPLIFIIDTSTRRRISTDPIIILKEGLTCRCRRSSCCRCYRR